MASPGLLTDNWSKGQISDVAPNRNPPNSALTMLNWIPDFGAAPLMKRAAWSYAYTAAASLATSVSTSSTGIYAIGYMQFTDGPAVIAIDQAGRIIELKNSGTGVLLDATGLAEAPINNPFWHLDRCIIPGSSGTKFPWQVTTNGSGTAAAAAFSNPFPKAKHGCSWQNYLLMSNGGDFADSYNIKRRRTWFSDPFLLTFTAANNSYLDWPDEIRAVVPMTNALVGFGDHACWIATGDTPPPNNNLVLRDLYPQGVLDARSIAMWNGYIIFANSTGIWKTDGTSLVNLTDRCGLSTQYKALTGSFTLSWTQAGGVFQNRYHLTTCNDSGVEQSTIVLDLNMESGYMFSGLPTRCYASVQTGPWASTIASAQDLLFGVNNVAQVGRLQPAYDQTAAGKADANGVVIPYTLTTPFYQMGTAAEKRFRRLFLNFDLDTSTGGDTPEIAYAITQAPSTANPTYTSMTFPTTTGQSRQPVFVNDKGRWISFRIRGKQSGPSGTTRLFLYSMELEGHSKDGSRSSA